MTLSKNNLELLTNFFLGNTAAFDAKDDDYKNLAMTYASDNNSSTVREAVTLYYLGYESYTEKKGPDGFDPKTGRKKEVKPQYIRSDSKKTPTFGGNFNDMTLELLEKKKDWDVICSVFVDTLLLCIVEFPLIIIYDRLRESILTQTEKKRKRITCNISHTWYKDSDQLIIHYYNKDVINKYKSKVQKIFEEKYDNQLSKQKILNKKSKRP